MLRRNFLQLTVLAVAVLSLIGPALPVVAKPAVQAVAQRAGKTDRDKNKLFDDLEARLSRTSARQRVSVIVTLNSSLSEELINGLKKKVGSFSPSHELRLLNAFAADLTPKQIRELAADAEVRHVEENSTVTTANDSAQQSFGVTQARVDAGVDGDGDGEPLTYSSADLVAAVIDTGIDANHLDLNGGKVLAFKDYVKGNTSPYDDNGHGTHVAATIAGDGEARADRLYKGVAPGAGLVGVKVLDSTGSGSMANVAAGIEWVIQNKDIFGIEAINLSLGTSGCSDGNDSTSLEVDKAHDAGIVVAVAAGNSGPGTCTIGSPGAARKALTVGATADTGVGGFKQAYFSSRGPTVDGRVKPDVSAPGVSITSASSGTTSGYKVLSGTSMATPFVAGLSLLMKDVNNALSSQDVKDKVMASAVDWGRGGDNKTNGSLGLDIDYGAGRLDGYAAIASAGAAITTPPVAPAHEFHEGTLSATGGYVDYNLNVTRLDVPVAATLILPSISGSSAWSPDFDLYLYNPSGTRVASAETTRRQDELGYTPTVTGTYRLRVASYSGSGQFFVDISAGIVPPPPPVPDTTAPAAPTGLKATAGNGSVTLDWTDNPETDAVSYKIYRTTDDTWSASAIATTTVSSYTDTGLTNGIAYTYRVSAHDASNNESDPSTEASETPMKPPVTKTYRPVGYKIVTGSLYSGGVSRLYNNDSSRLEINGVNGGTTYVSDMYAYASITSAELASLRKVSVNYEGRTNSSGAALSLSAYNWQTGSWEVVDGPRTGVTSDRSFTWSNSSTPANYVSATGEIRFKVTGTRSSSFRTQTDWIRFSIEY
jgi:serine protease AprX